MAPLLAVGSGMQKSAALVLSLVAVLIGAVAHPARAQQPPSRQQPVQQDAGPEPRKGEWWNILRREANAGIELAKGMRWGVVHGCMDGIETAVIAQIQSHDEYTKLRAALMRSDLTMDQILAKVDGYYAEPGNQGHTLCLAVLKALRPPAER